MPNYKYAAIDQGTTGTRVLILDEKGNLYSPMAIHHEQIMPFNGWVEHNPKEILNNIKKCLNAAGNFDCIGISHQGESVVAWDALTKEPIYNSIVWQDMRTAEYLDELKKQGLEPFVLSRSGLPLDAYFSASKMKWLMIMFLRLKI